MMSSNTIIAVEMTIDDEVRYFSTNYYTTASTDTPAVKSFEPRIMEDLQYERSVGCVFWGSEPRGKQNFGVIKLANTDGGLPYFIGQSWRDESVVIKIGERTSAYSTFETVATLIISRAEMTDENTISVWVTDKSALLERAIQTSLYASTTQIAYQPRPITFGRCYQVPFKQPSAFGNGQFDVHDNDNWIGVEQCLDFGSTLVEGNGYERSTATGIFGIERLTAIQGKQCATVLGAFKVSSTEITEDFAALTSWTEANGGAGGRDASIVSNALNLVNTAGGADLSVTWNASTPTGTDATYWFYEFNCTAWVSGYAQLRTEVGTVIQRTIDAAGRYTGTIRASGNVVPSFYAPNGSNCSLTIDSFRLRKVTPMTGLLDAIKFIATNDTTVGGHGPLTVSDLDTTSINALETAAPYALGFHISEPTFIADILDEIMNSFGGWWYFNRLGKLSVGRLESPSGVATFEFNQNTIESGVKIAFDEAKGLSNRALGKRNYERYSDESEIASSLSFVQLNSGDKDADVSITTNGYSYTTTNLGSVRSTPLVFGDRYYFEVTINTVGTNSNYVGVGNQGASVSNFPGGTANSIAYKSDGTKTIDGTGSAFGNSFIANDVIGVAIDARSAAGGSRSQGFRLYFAKNNTWQASADVDAETGFIASAVNATGIAFAMLGAGATGNGASINFGQSTFTYTPPTDYSAPAWHRSKIMQAYRDQFQSSTALDPAYQHAFANSSINGPASVSPEYQSGIPTLLTKASNLSTECNRWCGLFSAQKFFYRFEAFAELGALWEINPGDLVDVTYPKLGMANLLARAIAIKGSLLDRKFEITAWGNA